MTTFPKICFFGLGDHARRGHLGHLVNMDIAPEVGVYDPGLSAEQRAQWQKATRETRAYGKPMGMRFFEAPEEALEWADAVMICSPDRFHLPQMEWVVEFGCHVFCEKPLANTEEEAARLAGIFELARQKGVTVTSCHPRRFDPPYKNLRKMMPELLARYGALMEVKLDFSYHKPSKTGLHGGSMLQDHANHEIDYLMWLAGPCSFKATKLLDEEDRYHMSGVREDGVVFSFGGTRRLNSRIYGETIDLRFERGTVHVDAHDKSLSFEMDHDRWESFPLKVGATDYEERFSDLNVHWLRLIAGEEENYLTEAQMLLNTKMSVSFQKSDSLEIRI